MPVLRFFEKKDVDLTIASNLVDQMNELVGQLSSGCRYQLTEFMLPRDAGMVEELVGDHDVVISLLPYTMHVCIAEVCISLQKHMVTASYVSEEMKALHTRAVDAGITIINGKTCF